MLGGSVSRGKRERKHMTIRCYIITEQITNYVTDLKHKDFLKMSNFSSEQSSASVYSLMDHLGHL